MGIERKLLLIGGGGHCKSIIDCLITQGLYKDIGIVDNDLSASVLDIPIIGTDRDLSYLANKGWTDAFVSVGSIGLTEVRHKLYQTIKGIGFTIPSIIDSTAIIAKSTIFEEGVFVGKRVVINAGTVIGKCAILNTGSMVEHDCIVGEFAHISPGAVLCGQVSVGPDSHVGAGAVVRQGIFIGGNSLIGAGSVVVKDIPTNVKAYGNPCRVVE